MPSYSPPNAHYDPDNDPRSFKRKGAVDTRHPYSIAPGPPPGIAIIVALSVFLAVFLLLIFALAFVQSLAANPLVYLLPIPALFALVIGFGLWNKYPWARPIGIAFYAFVGIALIVNAFTHPFSLSDVLNVAIPIVVVACLLQPSVRAAFEHPSQLSDDQTATDN
jgi:hypothetical protein